MNLEWLQSFYDAVEQKSFSKAARINNLSQPALSKHIKNLESTLNVQLFYRNHSGSELTEVGQYFFETITPILSDIKKIKSELHDFQNKQPLVIGSLPSLAKYYLSPKI